MAFFKRKDKGVLDLTERYRKDREKAAEMRADAKASEESTTDSSNAFGFLGNMAAASGSSSTSDETVDLSSSVEARRKQLSKRLLDMTEKIEDISNQIYHLQQRIEVLERKSGVGRY